jgi:hypothetical protein
VNQYVVGKKTEKITSLLALVNKKSATVGNYSGSGHVHEAAQGWLDTAKSKILRKRKRRKAKVRSCQA